MSTQNRSKARPLTLYAEEVEFHPDITSTLEPSVRSVDVELTRVHVDAIYNMLKHIVASQGVLSVRIRFTGRMVQ